MSAGWPHPMAAAQRLEEIPGRIHHTIVEQPLLPQPQLLRGGSSLFEDLTTLHLPRLVGRLLFPRQRLQDPLVSFVEPLLELDHDPCPLCDASSQIGPSPPGARPPPRPGLRQLSPQPPQRRSLFVEVMSDLLGRVARDAELQQQRACRQMSHGIHPGEQVAGARGPSLLEELGRDPVRRRRRGQQRVDIGTQPRFAVLGLPDGPRRPGSFSEIPFRLCRGGREAFLAVDRGHAQGPGPVDHMSDCPRAGPPSRPAPSLTRDQVFVDHVRHDACRRDLWIAGLGPCRHRRDRSLDQWEQVLDDVLEEPIARIAGQPLDGGSSDLGDLLVAKPTRVDLAQPCLIGLPVHPRFPVRQHLVGDCAVGQPGQMGSSPRAVGSGPRAS